jgi:integrase
MMPRRTRGRILTTISLKYVHHFRDQGGCDRYYFRRHGRRIPLPGVPGSKAFMDGYAEALACFAGRPVPTRAKTAAGTFAALAPIYYASADFKSLAASTRANYRRVIDGFLEKHGGGRLDQFRRRHAIKIVGKMAATPGAAIVLLKRVRTLINFAIQLEWIETDPTRKVRSFKSKEFHTWTEEEIAQFEAHWPLGTKQRLAFDLLLYTGQRGSDAHKMNRPDGRGKIRLAQQKTDARLVITVHPELRASIEAMGASKHAVILATAYGRPFSVKGFGQFVSAAIVTAGLPSRCKAHGLRKAAARRLAEAGCSANQIMSVTGHRTLSEVEVYVRAAEQEKLNQQAMEKQSANAGVANPTFPIGKAIDGVGEK